MTCGGIGAVWFHRSKDIFREQNIGHGSLFPKTFAQLALHSQLVIAYFFYLLGLTNVSLSTKLKQKMIANIVSLMQIAIL